MGQLQGLVVERELTELGVWRTSPVVLDMMPRRINKLRFKTEASPVISLVTRPQL